jgi:MOSC domain-containing protein YiiM
MAVIENLRDLIKRFRAEGRVEAIVLRPERQQPAHFVSEVQAEPGLGLIGDRRSQVMRVGLEVRKRELTMFQSEHLPVVARWCGLESLEATRVRRNLVVSGINLLAMRSPFPDLRLEWQIGEYVCFEVTGSCDPCSRMESELGQGGYNALRGHGGVTARLLVGGMISVGDCVQLKGIHPLTNTENPHP